MRVREREVWSGSHGALREEPPFCVGWVGDKTDERAEAGFIFCVYSGQVLRAKD